jgi:transgelin
MASVTSLDQDMRNLRLGRYTPQAANEARQWIEESLGRSLAGGDLLDALKDGVALCELANMVLPAPGIKFKKSAMPFIQMENISHFLKACEMAPLNMPAHDRFLTVDLFESKDPAQVLQCLGAFSRQANKVAPNKFRNTIGPKKAGNPISPTGTGGGLNGSKGFGSASRGYGSGASQSKPSVGSNRPMSPVRTGGSTGSGSGSVSSWSKKTDEGSTAPAWNIHQYGYMGGASQGNQGISFGARRQITSQAPTVPSLMEKERARKEKVAEQQRAQQQAEEAEYERRAQREADEERERAVEEQRWQDETRRQREEERQGVEEQKRQWAEQERRWQRDQEMRQKEDVEIKRLMSKRPPEKPRVSSSSVLRGQTLSQYQQEQSTMSSVDGQNETPEQARVRELEKQLEEARERERQYQAEREERIRTGDDRSRPSTASTSHTERPSSAKESEASWIPDERAYLRKQWQSHHEPQISTSIQSGAESRAPPALPSRAQPQHISEPEPQPEEEDDEPPALPVRASQPSGSSSSSIIHFNPEDAPSSSPLGSANRPLPTPQPKTYDPFTPQKRATSRTDAFLASNAAPKPQAPRISSSQEAGDTSLEQSRDRDRRLASQQTTQAGGWASKSLLEREMERERERQREWEAEQKSTSERKRDEREGVNEGQTWDVNQYGYTGGDGMNRGSSSGSGIAIGGRRQIIGPRPQK